MTIVALVVALAHALLAVMLTRQRPRLPAAGVPAIDPVPLPLSVKDRPGGSCPASVSAGAG